MRGNVFHTTLNSVTLPETFPLSAPPFSSQEQAVCSLLMLLCLFFLPCHVSTAQVSCDDLQSYTTDKYSLENIFQVE